MDKKFWGNTCWECGKFGKMAAAGNIAGMTVWMCADCATCAWGAAPKAA